MSGKDYDAAGNRKEPYKEDSTKGCSLIEPVNYKSDMLVQVWMDSRIMASLLIWLEKGGNSVRFMSEVVREPLKVLVETLVEAEDMELIDDTLIARGILERKFRVDLSRGGKAGKNTLHNKVLSERRKEMTEKLRDRDYQPNDVARKVSHYTSDQSYVMIGGEKYVFLEEYPDYSYREGNEEMKEQVIAKLKAQGIKSVSELRAEDRARGIESTGAIKGDD
jgi:hypothetical protein